MQGDLERYAKSGNASPKAIVFRTTVLNAVVDGYNAVEEKLQTQVEALSARIKALENDLADREQTIKALHGAPTVDLGWSWLEGRAQLALNYKRRHIDLEEGRSMTPDESKRERKFLDVLEREMNVLYDANCALMMALGKEHLRYRALMGWCEMHGMDVFVWMQIPEDRHIHLGGTDPEQYTRVERRLCIRQRERMPKAVRLAHDRLMLDGIVDDHGIRTGRVYRNADAVCANILDAVVYEERQQQSPFKELNEKYCPDREPMWAWPPALERTLEPA